MRIRRSLLVAALWLLISVPCARAAETQPGDACTAGETDLYRLAGGPENPGTGYLLVCNGATWKAVTSWSSASGMSLFQVNNDAGACTAAKLGRIRYNGTNTWEYCNNANAWVTLGGASQWTTTGSDIYYNTGKVGIGTTGPGYRLHVEQDVNGGGVGGALIENGGTGYSSLMIKSDTDQYYFLVGGSGNGAAGLYITQGGFDRVFINKTTGNVGVGTTSPYNRLSVERTENTAVTSGTFFNGTFGGISVKNPSATANSVAGLQFIMDAGNNSIAGIGGIRESSSLGALGFFTGGGGTASSVPERMRITSSGNVGIGTTSPQKELDVAGSIQYSGTLIDVSDRRLKDNIAPLSGELDRLSRLQGVSFTMKSDGTHRTELGLIAQDVEPVFPELVSTDDHGMKALNYVGLVAPLIEAVKELKTENEGLKVENKALEVGSPGTELEFAL